MTLSIVKSGLLESVVFDQTADPVLWQVQVPVPLNGMAFLWSSGRLSPADPNKAPVPVTFGVGQGIGTAFTGTGYALKVPRRGDSFGYFAPLTLTAGTSVNVFWWLQVGSADAIKLSQWTLAIGIDPDAPAVTAIPAPP